MKQLLLHPIESRGKSLPVLFGCEMNAPALAVIRHRVRVQWVQALNLWFYSPTAAAAAPTFNFLKSVLVQCRAGKINTLASA